ncbi:MAG: MoaD/ThiS family protein [Firmicutes bacterium]|nr:MoaD/ThiS family protein [Bacillota bacterium]
MKITVRFFGYTMVVAGLADIALELREGSTVGDLLEEVGRRHPALVQGQGKGTGASATALVRDGYMLVSINRKHLDSPPERAPLADGDEVWLLPPVAGG